MAPLSFTQYLLPLILFLNAIAAQALTNFTVDDSSPSIAYAGNWEPSSGHTSALDRGGSHTVSSDATGSATFTFTGVAVYYIAPKWPYAVDSYLAIDGGSPVLVDMTAPTLNSAIVEETVAADVLWSATGLTSGIHKVVVTRGTAGFIIVDGFIYTAQGGDSSSQSISTEFSTSTNQPSTTDTGPSSTSTSTNSPTTPQSNSTIIIAAIVSVSIVFLVLLIALIIFFVWRRKKTKEANRDSSDGEQIVYTIPVSGANTYSAAGYSDGTNSVPPTGSLSAPQMTNTSPPLYNQDPYGLYIVSNAGLAATSSAVPSADASSRSKAAGGLFSATAYNNNGSGGADGRASTAATYAPTSPGLPPSAALPTSQLQSGKARYGGARNQQIIDVGALQAQDTSGGGGLSPTISHPYVYAASSVTAPPPYVAQHG